MKTLLCIIFIALIFPFMLVGYLARFMVGGMLAGWRFCEEHITDFKWWVMS